MTESESVALPLGDTPTKLHVIKKMGWMEGFEPSYTGATTLGLNHLTIPTILVNCTYYYIAVSQDKYFLLRVGDLERARTVDLPRDRLAF